MRLSFNESIELLKNAGAHESVINHCLMVSRKSAEIAEKILKNGYKVNVKLCQIGGLLHDIGRAKTHTIFHGVEGAELLKDYPELASIAKRHIGGGITEKEAVIIGLPAEDYQPVTLEEKIVCYADKLVQGEKFADSADDEIKKLSKKLGKNHPSIKRLNKIESELKELMK
ncbi:TIGR00295 family protein [archaeon CG_4_10_14_0_2_um_filter_Archaea_38_6]|nr:MAG: TIGR00295 family protein [archaeon CG_4_10_14_0_2_um_filter_Archaea_38_6]